ncbi:Inner membrane protein YqjA [Leminorella grimontii]|nr:Inner membrane protein YqjA [Leminorella grimontii]
MDVIHTLWQALWHHDVAMLTNPSLVWTLYAILFTILLLENGVLPAAFLPGDSLLLLVGVLVAKGAINYPIALVVLTAGASIGSWIGFLQGRWLGNTKVVAELAFSYTAPLSPTRPQSVSSPRPGRTVYRPLSGVCPYPSANACRHFRPKRQPLPVLQLDERLPVGIHFNGSRLRAWQLQAVCAI